VEIGARHLGDAPQRTAASPMGVRVAHRPGLIEGNSGHRCRQPKPTARREHKFGDLVESAAAAQFSQHIGRCTLDGRALAVDRGQFRPQTA
jgi:hypothetical protein